MAKARLNPREAEALRLNELARLYPWAAFTQAQLELMTGYGRAVIAAAFEDPAFPSQFGKSRPEPLYAWVQSQPAKIQVKEVA